MKLNVVKAANKDQGTCGKCKKEIKKGDGYLWWKGRYGPRHVRCPSCRPRASELESNEKVSALLAAIEDAEAGIDRWLSLATTDLSDLQTTANEAAEAVREVSEMFLEGQQNIEDGFQHSTSQSDEMGERGEALEESASNLESLSLEEWDENGGDEEEMDDEKEDRFNTWAEEQAQTVRDALEEIET